MNEVNGFYLLHSPYFSYVFKQNMPDGFYKGNFRSKKKNVKFV